MHKGSHHIRRTVKKADNVRFGQPSLPKCVFATKQHMFGVLAIVEILNYRGLPISNFKTKSETNTKTKTKTNPKIKTKILKDPTFAIFLKSLGFKDIKYDTHASSAHH